MVSKQRMAVTMGVVAGALALGLTALAQTPRGGAAAPRPRAVATVGTRSIDAQEFEGRVRAALEQYRSRGANVPAEALPTLRRQVLEGAIRAEWTTLEAIRTGALVSVAEAEEAMKRDPVFNPGGRFDETRWLTIRATQKPQFDAALARAREQLSGQKLAEQLLARFTPAEATLRAEAERELARVDIGQFGLRRADFKGTFPEPREEAVLAAYRSNRQSFARPDRATLSVVFVNTPGLTPAERADAARVREWNAAMRRSADSLLAAVRAGADFEVLAVPHGGIRPKVEATPAAMPAFWNGSAADQAALFRTPRGEFLPAPVPATEGYLVVRVDARSEAHVATLAEAAPEIRARLRDDLARNHVAYEMRDLYAAMRDSLAGPAWRVRWVFADPQSMRVPAPTEADLDRYYRSRLADYSRFDAQQGRIVATPLAEVRDDVRQRLETDRRVEAARTLAERVERAWSAGRRENAIERTLSLAETEPTPRGAPLDATTAGTQLAAALWKQGPDTKTGLAPVAGGFGVWQVLGRVDRHVPTFEQAQPQVKAEFDRRWLAREEVGGRALYDRDPSRFRGGDIIYYERASLTPPELLDVPLTRAEVEEWFRANRDKFSAPEQVRVRHLLVEPAGQSDEADRAARAKADALLARARGGEDFFRLVQEHSDDEPTRAKGGDLGLFGRGVMLPGFEDAAFRMRPGQFSGPVRTEAGYHILECLDYEPEVVQPLDLVYSNVASDAARVKAESLTVLRADSLLRAHRSPASLKAAIQKSGFEIHTYEHRIGDVVGATVVRPFFEALERTRAGQILRPAYRARGSGVWIAWVDSISPPRDPVWEEAKPRAVQAYREGAGVRALEAKRAEMDSLLAQGMPLDTLAALWGGFSVVADMAKGGAIPGYGAAAALDSFLFGGPGRTAPGVGETSGWLDLPNGLARVRVLLRTAPEIALVERRMQQLRSERIEVSMRAHFAEVAKRHPLRIHDPVLRDTPLPVPQAPSGSRAQR